MFKPNINNIKLYIIVILFIFLFQGICLGTVLRIGEVNKWRTLEPITARLSIEKRIASLLYKRMFLYDESIKNNEHSGLKSSWVQVLKADTRQGIYELRFKDMSFYEPYDFKYTLDLMLNSFYQQPEFIPHWNKYNENYFYYNPEINKNSFTITMKNGTNINKCNFHLVKNNSLGNPIQKDDPPMTGEKYINKLNSAARGPYMIDHIENRILSLKKRERGAQINNIEIIIVDSYNNLIDRLSQGERNNNSIDIIPEIKINDIDKFKKIGLEKEYIVSSPSSNNFWMIGFNYDFKDKEARKLFHILNFRKYVSLLIDTQHILRKTIEISSAHSELLCGPLFKRSGGLDVGVNDFEFCSSKRISMDPPIDRLEYNLNINVRRLSHVTRSGNLLKYRNKPIIFKLVYFQSGVFKDKIESIASGIKNRFKKKGGIIIETSPVFTMKKWQETLEKRDFDLIIKQEHYDYSYDVTPFFTDQHPLNICGVPNDIKIDLNSILSKYHSAIGKRNKIKHLIKLNALLSNNAVAIFLWNLKYKTVYRSVLNVGNSNGINDMDMFQNIDEWSINEINDEARK